MTNIALAELLHEKQREFAGAYGYDTQEIVNKPWQELPESYRLFMLAVVDQLVTAMNAE